MDSSNYGWVKDATSVERQTKSQTSSSFPERAMAPHSSTLAWRIPWTEEPGGLQSMGSQRVGQNWVTSLSISFSCTGEGNGNPLRYSWLENPRDSGAGWAAVYGVAQSRTRMKWLSSGGSSILISIHTVMEAKSKDKLTSHFSSKARKTCQWLCGRHHLTWALLQLSSSFKSQRFTKHQPSVSVFFFPSQNTAKNDSDQEKI